MAPSSIVIVGGGAAGLAAADMLRREGYDGRSCIMSAPTRTRRSIGRTCRRTISPARRRTTGCRCGRRSSTPSSGVELRARRRVSRRSTPARRTVLARRRHSSHVRRAADRDRRRAGAAARSVAPTARSLLSALVRRQPRDRRSAAQSATRVVVVGASFIGLEVAASLRTRGIDVRRRRARDACRSSASWAPRSGASSSRCTKRTASSSISGRPSSAIDGRRVTLSGGDTLDADFVVIGVGVRPATALAEQAGLALDRGIVVNEYLETSAPGIFAAGDVARWPDPHTGERIRVEHWVVAERQGQVAARNMLGPSRAVRRRAVLLEPALRRHDPVCRSRQGVGCGAGRRLARRSQMSCCLSSRWPATGGRDCLARSPIASRPRSSSNARERKPRATGRAPARTATWSVAQQSKRAPDLTLR